MRPEGVCEYNSPEGFEHQDYSLVPFRPGLYEERFTLREFTFQKVVGVAEPLRHYFPADKEWANPHYPNIHRILTREEKIQAEIERPNILAKYIQPVFIQPSSLKIACLIAIREEDPIYKLGKCGIFKQHLLIEDSLHQPCITIVDYRPVPCNFDSATHKITPFSKSDLNSFVTPRFIEWDSAGGFDLYLKGEGPPFWFDLWNSIEYIEHPKRDLESPLHLWYIDYNNIFVHKTRKHKNWVPLFEFGEEYSSESDEASY
jgi:hypothetical protein